MIVSEIISILKQNATEHHKNQLKKFNIKTTNALGVKMPDIRKIAKGIEPSNSLAFELIKSEIHEAKLLASMLLEPDKLTEIEFDRFVGYFDDWDICDCACTELMKSPFAIKKVNQYAYNQDVFIKRTAFVLMCSFAVHDKAEKDIFFYPFFEIIESQAWDERNFVKKAISWALRQIGKRNSTLRVKAIAVAKKIKTEQPEKSAQWIANDVIRELTNEKIIAMVAKR